jgi:TPR repeat protein
MKSIAQIGGTLLLLAAAIFGCGAPTDRAANPPASNQDGSQKARFDAGFDLFNGYEATDAERVRGWQIMLDVAKEGDLDAKKTVADYAAGFMSLNKDPQQKTSFKPNLALALQYYRELVKCGGIESRVRLALLYSSGVGEPADDSESPHKLLIGAAAKRNKEAMALLAQRYLYGYGEDRDVLEAARWQFLASMGPGPSSQWIDLNGEPRIQETVEEDEMARTLSLFFKAGKLGHTTATAKLKALFAAASKPFNLGELIKAAQQSSD